MSDVEREIYSTLSINVNKIGINDESCHLTKGGLHTQNTIHETVLDSVVRIVYCQMSSSPCV